MILLVTHTIYFFLGNTIPEDAPLGTAIGVLSASDEDVGQTMTYSVENKESVPFSVSGNSLVVDGPLDYELEGSITVTVVGTDSGIPPLSVS